MIWWVRLWFGDSKLLQILVRCQCVKGFLCWFVVKTIDLFMLKKTPIRDHHFCSLSHISCYISISHSERSLKIEMPLSLWRFFARDIIFVCAWQHQCDPVYIFSLIEWQVLVIFQPLIMTHWLSPQSSKGICTAIRFNLITLKFQNKSNKLSTLIWLYWFATAPDLATVD